MAPLSYLLATCCAELMEMMGYLLLVRYYRTNLLHCTWLPIRQQSGWSGHCSLRSLVCFWYDDLFFLLIIFCYYWLLGACLMSGTVSPSFDHHL